MNTPTSLACASSLVFLSLMVSQVFPQGLTLTDSPECDDGVTLIYDPATGNLSFTVAPLDPVDQNKLSRLEIQSQGGLFDESSGWCVCMIVCNGACKDICLVPGVGTCESSAAQAILLNPQGFGDFDFGELPPADFPIPDLGRSPLLPVGLSGDDLVSDLIIDGSYLTGGTLDKYNPDSPFLYVVPEPSAALLGLLGTLGLLLGRRHC